MKKRAVVASLGAGEFKARCLELMDEVAATGKAITITKRGVPVAQLTALRTAGQPLRGAWREQIRIEGDLLAPIDVDWDADQ